MFQTIEERAAEGAKFLDEERPGWYKTIELERLALSDCTRCVLGQLFGVFGEGTDALGLYQVTDTYRLGFSLSAEESDTRWYPLTAAWKAEIQARLDKENTQ